MLKVVFNLPTFRDINRKGVPVRGGQISNYHLIISLTEKNRVTVITTDPNCEKPLGDEKYNLILGNSIIKKGICGKIFRHLTQNILFIKYMLFNKYVIVFCATTTTLSTYILSRIFNFKYVIITRAYEHSNITGYKDSNSLFTKLNLTTRLRKQLSNAYKHSVLIITNSNFMKKLIINEFNPLSVKVINPPHDIQVETHSKSSKLNYIGFIGSTQEKGINLIFELAKLLPQHKFIIFGDETKIKANHLLLNNIIIEKWEWNREKLFSQFAILLVPSVWDEPYGRIAVEALASGVIPLVSDKGGLPEAVKSSELVIKSLDIHDWQDKIFHVINNYSHYNNILQQRQKSLKDDLDKNIHKKEVQLLIHEITTS